VQLDEIFRTFNPKTRIAFEQWMQNASIALKGQGQALSNAFGELEPTFTQADQLLRVLDTQSVAVKQLIANGGTVFQALSQRQGQLAGLIRNSDRVFTTTAQRNHELENTFIAFPTFLDQSRATLTRLQRFAENADPLARQLQPSARDLAPVVRDLGRLSGQLNGFFIGLRPVVAGARRAFPALRRLLVADFPPLLNGLQPFLKNFNPFLQVAQMYKHELTAFLGNAAAATNATGAPLESNNKPGKYLRVISPLSPDVLAGFNTRLSNNRANPYHQPLGFLGVGTGGMQSFETSQCSGGPFALLNPNTPNDPAFNARTGGDVAQATDFFNRLKQYAFDNNLNSANIPNVACTKQGPFTPIGQPGAATDYLHTFQQP
jgi:phospholipid/cholesterol/gamma-HCH transport system substrate-binding protein